MSKKNKNRSKSKTKLKTNPQRVSLFRSKYYWITLTLILLVFTFVYGILNAVSAEKEALMVSSILFLIGIAFYVGFKPFKIYPKRATFMFAGAVIIGAGIWIAMVLSLNATGVSTEIASSIGGSLFLSASLMICWISGAFMGDIIGKNKERIGFFINDKFGKQWQWIREKLS